MANQRTERSTPEAHQSTLSTQDGIIAEHIINPQFACLQLVSTISRASISSLTQWRGLNPRLDATMMNLAWWAPGKVNEAQWEISSSPPVCWRDAGGVGGVGDNRAWLSPVRRGIAAHTGSIKAWPSLLVKLQKWDKANRGLKMAGEI